MNAELGGPVLFLKLGPGVPLLGGARLCACNMRVHLPPASSMQGCGRAQVGTTEHDRNYEAERSTHRRHATDTLSKDQHLKKALCRKHGFGPEMFYDLVYIPLVFVSFWKRVNPITHQRCLELHHWHIKIIIIL